MKSKSCGWRVPHSLGRRSYGQFGGNWRQGKPRLKDEDTAGASSYFNHVANAASFEAFNRQEIDPLLSAEALPENSSLIDFKSFAAEYPDKLFPLLARLRPEFQELFIEYYLLQKSQSFIAKCHGFIQTRTWQNLRIIEQTIGSLILLGTDPDKSVLLPIIQKASLETTPFGSLTQLILLYAASQNYAFVAKTVGAPVPAIRKIFRPAITALLADKDIHAVAVGAYLRSLTHHASLTGAGLSKRCMARTRRVKNLRFSAPASDDSPLLSFGAVTSLHDTPWAMLEISSDHRMTQIYPLLKTQGKRIFGKKPAQIFASVNAEGELAFGYIFARSLPPSLVRALTRVRGISEISAIRNDEGAFVRAVTVPNADVQVMMDEHVAPPVPRVHLHDFVEILTGPAARYFGTITKVKKQTGDLIVNVNFPTGRHFIVTANASCVKLLPKVPAEQRSFWGVRSA